jgi:hypothetical protein
VTCGVCPQPHRAPHPPQVRTNDVLGGPINPNPNSGYRAELLGRDGAPLGRDRETVKSSIQGWASLI